VVKLFSQLGEKGDDGAEDKADEELARSAEVVAFVRRFGSLGICEAHKKPASHDLSCRPARGSYPSTGGVSAYLEPLDAWYRLARQTRAVLNLAHHLHKGQCGTLKDWETLGGAPDRHRYFFTKTGREREDAEKKWAEAKEQGGHPEPLYAGNPLGLVVARQTTSGLDGELVPSWTETYETIDPADEKVQLARERSALADHVNEWLRDGNARLTLAWRPNTGVPVQELKGSGLWGALVVQLAAMVARREMVPCSACGNLTTPRADRPGEDHYCEDDACKKKSRANASKAYRGRNRARG
jgi:hypothetical protein